MRQWVLEAEYMLDGTWSEQEHAKEKKEQSKKKEDKKNRWCVTNEEVGRRFDTWRQDRAQKIREGTEDQKACECFEQFLQVLANMRPYLIQCYNLEGFPRTNNETEGSIRRIKARYRRISGRKNWNAYLLRYGRCIVFYEWWEEETRRWQHLEKLACHVSPDRWRRMRKETTSAQSEQLKRFRFRHKRTSFLTSLENRWATAAQSILLP